MQILARRFESGPGLHIPAGHALPRLQLPDRVRVGVQAEAGVLGQPEPAVDRLRQVVEERLARADRVELDFDDGAVRNPGLLH